MSKEKHNDAYYLKMALAEAKKGRYTTSPNPAVGCVIVRDHKILGIGYHHCAGQAHAEVMALRDANYEVAGATCYVTLEPCSHYGRTPPCAQALIDAQVKKVVIGSTDPNPKVAGKGIKMLLDANIEVVKAQGKLNKECLKLNRAFFKSITTNRPFTILKYGMSLDGKVALSTNESKWITNEKARRDVQRLRLSSDVIITSYKTVIADNPKLNVRLEDLPKKILQGVDTTLIKQPLKVIVDSRASLLPNLSLDDLAPYSLFTQGENYIVVGCNELKDTKSKRNTKRSKKTLECACAPLMPTLEGVNQETTKSSSQCVSQDTTKPSAVKKAPARKKRANKDEQVQKSDKKAPEIKVSVKLDEVKSWHIDESKVIARGKNFVVEQWSERVFIVAVPFAKGADNKMHACVRALLDFLGSKDIRVAMVEAGSNLGATFLAKGLIDECYCYLSPMILGLEAKSAFAVHEPKNLASALRFNKIKLKTFKNNICMILSEPQIQDTKK